MVHVYTCIHVHGKTKTKIIIFIHTGGAFGGREAGSQEAVVAANYS